MLISRYVVPKRLCGLRNQSVSTPSSDTRFSTPFDPTIAVFTAPARIRKPTTTTNAWNARRSGSGPTTFIASPEIRLSKNCGRTASGMIATAKKLTSDVNSRL